MNTISDMEPCPHCGEVPLEVIDGYAECPNCGSTFDEDELTQNVRRQQC